MKDVRDIYMNQSQAKAGWLSENKGDFGMDNSEKLKALDAAISKIEKDFGKGAIMKLGDKSKNMDVETVPTGSLSLDLALGLGGLEGTCCRDLRTGIFR